MTQSLPRRRRSDAYWLASALLALTGCGDPAPVAPIPTPPDAAVDAPRGDGGALPEPPPECDQVLPSAAMDTPPPSARFEELFTPTRGVGDDIYYRSSRQGGIWVVTVPDATPRLVVPPLAGVPFQDMWIEEDAIYLASYGALYSAPRGGGPATLLPNHTPMVAGDPEEGDDGWRYARAGDFLYFSRFESPTKLRRVPWKGGPIEVVGELPTRVGRPVVGEGTIYWAAIGTSVQPPIPDTLWALSIAGDAAKSPLVKLFEGTRGLTLFGFNAGLYAKLDVDRHVGFFAPNFAWTQKPDPVANDPAELLYGSAVFEGQLYFMATRWFSDPNSESAVQRPVLMRVGPGSKRADLVRCVSFQRSDIPPKDQQFLFGNPREIFATDTGVFGTIGPVTTTSRPGETTTYPHVIKFWPPP